MLKKLNDVAKVVSERLNKKDAPMESQKESEAPQEEIEELEGHEKEEMSEMQRFESKLDALHSDIKKLIGSKH